MSTTAQQVTFAIAALIEGRVDATWARYVRPWVLAAWIFLTIGIPLGSQTVLLKGVNDDSKTIRELVHKLLKIRVKPYYLYQADMTMGTDHFRTHVEKGLEIIRDLAGHTSGMGVPYFVIDAPGGGGKVRLLPDSVIEYNEDEVIVKNYEGKVFRYPQPKV